MGSPARRRVVVDDNDSRILYSSEFFVDVSGKEDGNGGNFGTTFQSTLHGTKGNGSFQFTFSGTQVALFGTTSGRTADPTWECFVDNVSIGRTNPFQFKENNWLLCEVDNLPDVQHVLTVNANSRGHTFWFDYLQYTPSPNATLSDSVVLVDHTDAAIRYDASWRALANIANVTTSRGASAVFDFIGSGLQWYGITPTEFPHGQSFATYSIDGANATSIVLQGLPSPATVTQHNQLIFQTPSLAQGPHSITVTFLSNGSSTPLTVAYLIIQNVTQAPSESAATATGALAPGTTTGATTSPFSEAGASKQSNAANIIGGVLGALFFLLSIVAAYFFFKLRRRAHAREPVARTTVATPFQLPSRRVSDPNSVTALNAPSQAVADASPPVGDIQLVTVHTQQQQQQYQQPAHRRRHSQRVTAIAPPVSQPSGVSSSRPAYEEITESTPYYGGYQTWGQAKALEAKSQRRPRDSYL